MNSFSIASVFTETQKTAPQNVAQKQTTSPEATQAKENSSSFGHVYNSNNQPVDERDEHSSFGLAETELVDSGQDDVEEDLSLESPDQDPNIQDENDAVTDETRDAVIAAVDDALDDIPTKSGDFVDVRSRDQSVTSLAYTKTHQDLPPSKLEFSPPGNRPDGAEQVSKLSMQNTDTLPNKDVAQHAILGQSTVRDPAKLMQPGTVAQTPNAQTPTLEKLEVNKSALTDRTSGFSTKNEAHLPVEAKQESAALVLPKKPSSEPSIEHKKSTTTDLSTPKTPSSSDPYSAAKSVSELAHNTAMRPNVYFGSNGAPTQSIVPASLAKSEPSLVRDNDVPIMSSELRATGTTPSTSLVGQVASSNQASLARHVSKQISEALRNTAQRPVEISLNPAELGRLRMTVTTVDGAVTLQVLAERPETLDLMRKNMDSLTRDLSDLGFTSIDLAFGQGKDADAEKRSTGSSNGLTRNEPIDEKENIDAQIAIPPVHLDGSSRLDIRV